LTQRQSLGEPEVRPPVLVWRSGQDRTEP